MTQEFYLSAKETVKLYVNKRYALEQIAKIRDVKISTIHYHLRFWYVHHGDIHPNDFVTHREEQFVLIAMAKAENYQYLSQVKALLPETIDYEKIRWVIAKMQRIKLK